MPGNSPPKHAKSEGSLYDRLCAGRHPTPWRSRRRPFCPSPSRPTSSKSSKKYSDEPRSGAPSRLSIPLKPATDDLGRDAGEIPTEAHHFRHCREGAGLSGEISRTTPQSWRERFPVSDAPLPSPPPAGGEGRVRGADEQVRGSAHLTLPLRGPLPLPPEGRRGALAAGIGCRDNHRSRTSLLEAKSSRRRRLSPTQQR